MYNTAACYNKCCYLANDSYISLQKDTQTDRQADGRTNLISGEQPDPQTIVDGISSIVRLLKLQKNL